jgi:Zn-dependent protease with chaperone function
VTGATGATGPPCPSCGAPTYTEGGWPAWCPDCEWGLVPASEEREPGGRWSEWRKRRMNARVLAIHQRLLGSDLRADRHYRAIGAFLGVLVHLTTLALVVAAGWIWTTGTFVVAKVILTVLLVVIAWEMRPRLHTAEPDSALTRNDAPSSFRVLDEVARVTTSRAPDLVVVSAGVNASFGRSGLRGPRVLTLGLPLWNVLTDRERLAVLGHECGHEVNGDIRSLVVVRTAINALSEWAGLLRPTRRKRGIGRSSVSLFSLAELLVPLLLLPLSVVTGLLALGLGRLAARSGQRAEYQADDLAAVTAGTDAATSLMEASLVAERSIESMRIMLRADREADVWARQRELMASLPEGQRERWRRLAARELHRTDASHPPTLLREDMLRSRPQRPPALDPGALAMDAMTTELFTRRDDVSRRLRDDAPG